MTVNEILEMMKYELDSYENPGAYLEDTWYAKCDAKADILREMIVRIESSQKMPLNKNEDNS